MIIKRNEQSIPIGVFKETLLEYLETGKINKTELLIKVKNFHKGENRAKKAMNAIYSTITYKSSVINFLKRKFNQTKFKRLSEYEQNLLCIALLCLRFPFYYEILFILGKFFAIQDSVNKRYITKAITAKFGANIGVEIAISVALRNFIESKTIKKIKRGLYGKPDNFKVCDLVKEVWKDVWFVMNNGKKTAVEDLKFEPFMFFI